MQSNMADVPQIVPTESGETVAYHFLFAKRASRDLWLTLPQGTLVIARHRPTQNAVRIGCVTKTDGMEAT